MPGIFHTIFGFSIGLLAWKLAEGKNGEKRFSLSLIFVFAINNYIGPDFGQVLESIGDAFGSVPLMDLGDAIHSYLGFLLFAIPWAVMWYAILLGIEQARVHNLEKSGHASEDPVIHASYANVLVMVVAGGIAHHFVDSIGHPASYAESLPEINFPSGRFILVPTMTPGFWLAYGVAIAAIAAIAMLYLINGIRLRRFSLREKIMTTFKRDMLWAAIFVGIVVLNVVLMYSVMENGDLIKTTSRGIYFYLGNLLLASIADGNAYWWIAMSAAPTILLFFLSHAKAWRVHAGSRYMRVDLLVLICYAATIMIGYALEPVIGGVSGNEADLGALVYTWSTVGSIILGLVLARGTVSRPLPAST